MSSTPSAGPAASDTKTDSPVEHHDVAVASPPLRIEDLTTIGTPLKACLLFGCFLVAYVYGLDYSLRSTYQSTATASYDKHSLLATVATARYIVAAACQPLFARGSDRIGRGNILYISVLLYVVGTIIQAASKNMDGFVAGSIIYQLGYTGMQLMVEVLIADSTSLRNRLVASLVPVSPFIINTWVSGTIASRVLASGGWQWGIGMFAIIMPIAALPLMVSLFIVERKRAAAYTADANAIARPHKTIGHHFVDFFWEVDMVGLALLLAIFALILLPLTLAGGITSTWRSARIIVMLVVGFLTIAPFVVWETRYARFPIMRKEMIANRTILGSLGISILLNTWWLQGNYLYTVVYVAFGKSITTATRTANIYSFVATLSGFGVGIVVRYFRRVKKFMYFGVVLFAVGFGILIHYRGGTSYSQFAGMFGAQVVLGIAGGFFTYPGQLLIQASVPHEHLAVVTSLYLACYYLGASVMESVAGAVWTQTLPNRLVSALGNVTLASEVYASPFSWAIQYPVGTFERTQVIEAYRGTQLILTVIAVAMCLPLLGCVALVKDYRLGDGQSRLNKHGEEIESDRGDERKIDA